VTWWLRPGAGQRAHRILIPRGGPRPWRSYQQSRAYRYATLRFCRLLATVRGEVMRSSKGSPKGDLGRASKSQSRSSEPLPSPHLLAKNIPMSCTDPLSAQPTPAPQSRAQHRLHSTYPPSTDKRTRHNGRQSPSRATLDPQPFPRTALHRRVPSDYPEATESHDSATWTHGPPPPGGPGATRRPRLQPRL
jgi:hypothetical protein